MDDEGRGGGGGGGFHNTIPILYWPSASMTSVCPPHSKYPCCTVLVRAAATDFNGLG